jgi:hypothetical protein
MRRALLACCLLLAVAGCGSDDEERPAAASPDDPVTAPADSAPSGAAASPEACRKLGKGLVDEPIDAAVASAERRGCTVRAAVIDGEAQQLTEDFQPARINVHVHDGVVTRFLVMG